MRRFIFSAVLMATVVGAYADGVTRIVVHSKSGDSVAYEMTDEPSVKFDGDSVRIALGNETASIAVDDVAKMTYQVVGATTGVSLPDVANKPAQIIRLRKGDNLIQVSTVGGAVVYEATLQSDGEDFAIPCELTPGIYVVKVNSLTFKMLKR